MKLHVFLFILLLLLLFLTLTRLNLSVECLSLSLSQYMSGFGNEFSSEDPRCPGSLPEGQVTHTHTHKKHTWDNCYHSFMQLFIH